MCLFVVGFPILSGKRTVCFMTFASTARTLLLMVVCIAAGGTVILENPATSFMFETKYFRKFVRTLKRVGLPVAWFCDV